MEKVQYWIKKNDTVWVFIIIVALQLLVASFYMNGKQLMYIDEFYCYEGAHNALLYRQGEPKFYLATHDEWYDDWHTKEEFMECFEVRGEESILRHSPAEVKSLLKTQNTYYILLNIVESFQSDPEMTKWSGFVLNSIIFVFHQIVLYLIGWEIFRDKKKALLPMIIYGFSPGGITLIVYIRFYLLKSLMCLLIAYIHLQLLKWRSIWGIIAAYGVMAVSVSIVLAFQPYVVLYAASAVFAFMIVCVVSKEYKLLLKYVGIGFAGAVAAALCASNVTERISKYASSYFGELTIWHFLHRPFRWYAAEFKFFVIKAISHVAGGIYTITAVGIMLAVIWYIQNKKEKVKWKKPEYFNIKACYIIGVSICYMLVFFRIVFEMWYRYMSCVYPGLCVGIAILLAWVLESCRVRRRGAVVCAVVLIGLFFGYTRGYVDEIYPGALEMREALAEYPDVDNLFVELAGDGGEQYYRDGYLINEGTSLYRIWSDSVSDTDYGFLDELNGEGFLCWVPVQEDGEYDHNVIDQVLVRTDYKEYERVFTTYHSNIYYVY